MKRIEAEELRLEVQAILPGGYTCGDILDEDHVRRGPGGSKHIMEQSSFFIHRVGGDVFDAFVVHIRSRSAWYALQGFCLAFQRKDTLVASLHRPEVAE